MKHLITILAVIILVADFGSAQPPDTLWTRTYGRSDYDYLYCVQQTEPDGGFVAAGCKAVSGSGTDLWIFKTDPNGDLLWEHTWGGSYNDAGYWVEQTNDGGYIVVGSYYPDSYNYDACLRKYDTDGNLTWSYTYNYSGVEGDDGHCVQQTSDGGYIFAGGTYTGGGNIWDFYLVKVDSAGTIEWQRSYPEGGYEAASFVRQTSDGGYVLCGYHTPNFPVPHDGRVFKTDANGNTQWTYTFGGSGGEGACCVRQTVPDGGYIVAGMTESYGAGSSDYVLLKLTASGTRDWWHTFGGSGVDEAYSVVQTDDGGYAILGSLETATSDDYWLIKTDSQGQEEWDETYGGANDERGVCVAQTSDGGYILGGSTQSYGAGGWDGWLVRLGPSPGGVIPADEARPDKFALLRAFPNPFNPSTRITYDLPTTCPVTLEVFDLLGRCVANLAKGVQPAGNYSILFDGSGLPSGLYFYRLQAGNFIQTQKMVLLK